LFAAIVAAPAVDDGGRLLFDISNSPPEVASRRAQKRKPETFLKKAAGFHFSNKGNRRPVACRPAQVRVGLTSPFRGT
jgi:hypothetical protein